MIYKVGNIEMYADNGSIVVVDNAKHKQQRVAVPDMQARMEAVAIAGLNKRGSQYGLDRDIYAKTIKYVQAMYPRFPPRKAFPASDCGNSTRPL